jgi:chitinase
MAVMRKQKPRDPIPPSLEPPPRQLSLLRVLILVVVLAALIFGGWKLVDHETAASAAKSDAVPVYAPYVDVTLTPTYPFQLPSANPVSSVYLAFVVSDSSEPCTPSWGNYYTLDQAETGLDLDARTAQLRNQGGSVMVSYGGQANSDLAVGCTDPEKLKAAYLAPVNRYHASAIDLDLEGATLADRSADARRAAAIAAVQKQASRPGKPLTVWVTLPVSAAGLTGEGEQAVRSLLDAGVKLAGVNAMAMDFGTSEAAEDMLGTVEHSLAATHSQVEALWRGAGLESGAAAAWGHVGATVMIGVNDDTDEHFTVRDAHGLAAFVDKVGIPRVSAWSLNRDSQCGGAFPRTGMLSNTCSGVVQKPLEFTKILSELRGTKTARHEAAAPRVPAEAAKAKPDDPAKSPYPVWRPSAAYLSSYKVVWQGQIYEASWWNQGTPPGSAAADSPTGPWQPIGPVPPGSRAPKLVTLAEGSFPAWSPSAVYHQGDRVEFDRLPYQARWYTKGEQPLSTLPSDPSAPWEPLFNYPGEPTAAEPTGAEG